jgi:hypothetical protein
MSNFSSHLTKFAVLTTVYLFGRFNFPFSCVLPFLYSFIRDSSKKCYTVPGSSQHEVTQVLTRLNFDVPSWVLFPDVERAEWINTITRLLWPKVNSFVEEILRKFADKLKENENFKNFCLEKVDLGKSVRHFLVFL